MQLISILLAAWLLLTTTVGAAHLVEVRAAHSRTGGLPSAFSKEPSPAHVVRTGPARVGRTLANTASTTHLIRRMSDQAGPQKAHARAAFPTLSLTLPPPRPRTASGQRGAGHLTSPISTSSPG